MGRPIVIDKAKLSTLKDYAENNVVTTDRLLAMLEKTEPPVGDYPEHVCFLSKFKIVYSIEQQFGHLFRHLSVSAPDSGRLPSVLTILTIMEELGFRNHNTFDDSKVWEEEIGKNRHAINILQQY